MTLNRLNILTPITDNVPDFFLTQVVQFALSKQERSEFERASRSFQAPESLSYSRVINNAALLSSMIPNRLRKKIMWLSRFPKSANYFVIDNCPGGERAGMTLCDSNTSHNSVAADYFQICLAMEFGDICPVQCPHAYGVSFQKSFDLNINSCDSCPTSHSAKSWITSRCTQAVLEAPKVYLYSMNSVYEYLLAHESLEVIEVLSRNEIMTSAQPAEDECSYMDLSNKPILDDKGYFVGICGDIFDDNFLLSQSNYDSQAKVFWAIEKWLEAMYVTGVRLTLSCDKLVAFSPHRGHLIKNVTAKHNSNMLVPPHRFLNINTHSDSVSQQMTREYFLHC